MPSRDEALGKPGDKAGKGKADEKKPPPKTVLSSLSTSAAVPGTRPGSPMTKDSARYNESPTLRTIGPLRSEAGGERPATRLDATATQKMIQLVDRLAESRKRGPGHEVPLSRQEVQFVCDTTRPFFQEQPMLVEIAPPIKIAGDIHGQFMDLLRLFEHCGWPQGGEGRAGQEKCRYLFLGDYVDRGRRGVETIVLLFCYKALFPSDFYLLRGNHECAAVTKIYGFYDEVKRRYDEKLWKIFVSVFDWMPIAGLVGGTVLCMHGGLSPELKSLDQIRNIERPCDVPDYGLMCDILWSDPNYDLKDGWAESSRGLSFTYGPGVVTQFCRDTSLDLICRAHQVVARGYHFFAHRRFVTIFSAPNYCGEYCNDAAVLEIDSNLICQFAILRPDEKLKISYKEQVGVGVSNSTSSVGIAALPTLAG